MLGMEVHKYSKTAISAKLDRRAISVNSGGMEFLKPTSWKVIIAILLIIPSLWVDGQLVVSPCMPPLFSKGLGEVPSLPFYCNFLFPISSAFDDVSFWENFALVLAVLLPFLYLISCIIVFLAHKLRKENTHQKT